MVRNRLEGDAHPRARMKAILILVAPERRGTRLRPLGVGVPGQEEQESEECGAESSHCKHLVGQRRCSGAPSQITDCGQLFAGSTGRGMLNTDSFVTCV